MLTVSYRLEVLNIPAEHLSPFVTPMHTLISLEYLKIDGDRVTYTIGSEFLGTSETTDYLRAVLRLMHFLRNGTKKALKYSLEDQLQAGLMNFTVPEGSRKASV